MNFLFKCQLPLLMLFAWSSDSNPYVLKIDVEGAELLLSKGACKTLDAIRPVIIFGFHPLVFTDPSSVERQIRSLFVVHNYTIQNLEGEYAEYKFSLEEYLAIPLQTIVENLDMLVMK